MAWLLSRDPPRRGPVFTVLHLDSLIMITVTGLVYAVVLAPIWNPTGWTKVADQTLHYAVPILAVLAYVMAGPRPQFTLGTVLQALLLPLGLWGLYTDDPQPFHRLPKGRRDQATGGPTTSSTSMSWAMGKALLNMLGVAVLLLMVGAVFLLLDRTLPAKPAA